MEAIRFLEASVVLYRNTRRCNPEGHTLHTYICENLTPNICTLLVHWVFRQFFYFEKSRFMRSPWCLCVCMPPCHLSMSKPMSMKLGIYILVPEPVSTAYLINRSHQSVCLDMSPSFARQRLSKNVTAVTNTQATVQLFKFLY
jgi:hypothetical protein